MHLSPTVIHKVETFLFITPTKSVRNKAKAFLSISLDLLSTNTQNIHVFFSTSFCPFSLPKPVFHTFITSILPSFTSTSFEESDISVPIELVTHIPWKISLQQI